MEIRELTDEGERRDAVPILRQLWDDVPPADVLEWTADPDYHLFGGFVDGEPVCVAGVSIEHLLHHTRHAWLYDLVVDQPRREEGYGSMLIAFVEEWADERGCEYVALASPLEKDRIHRYYRDRGYGKWGYIIEKEL